MRKLGTVVVLLAVCLLAVGVVGATSVDVSWSGSGDIYVNAENNGNYAEFSGYGAYISGDFLARDDGSYIDTSVYAFGLGAHYDFTGMQKLAGYTRNSAGVIAWSEGDYAQMNLRFDQSMYRVELERTNNHRPLLHGSGDHYSIGLGAVLSDGNTASAMYSIEVTGIDGVAEINTNQWHPTVVFGYGWGNPDSINIPDRPGYYTPTNHVSAVGYGEVTEYGFGSHYVNWNGYEMPNGGEFEFTAHYDGAFSAHPDVTLR